ncbi:hypothetical protein [Vibrio phage 2 TSL-2019]|uniref:Big-1 domain-containing protein n=1 Tax=Vibrio phage 2 TSL-2019 TaxID=2508172 RepID=A0A513PW65_9CAUD|nr:hypothetical protein HWC03_gp029 [Vibrio phage 2 TSL-2019]QAU04184.1 hypothetical protein [Vibrio phage 2 TSL-2019]
MAGIIKGTLLDANGDLVVPGKPVTLKAVRSDGLPDVTITTNADGEWSFEVNAEVDSTVDFTFIYNGVDVGAHAVRFYETAETVALPYSNSRVLMDKSASIAFAVKDPDGNGIPYADVTIHRGEETSEPVTTLRTDQFGIVTYTVPPHNVYERVGFWAKSGGTTAFWGVQYEDGEEEFAISMANFHYTEQLGLGNELLVMGGGNDPWGSLIYNPPKVLFNKDTLTEVTYTEISDDLTNNVFLTVAGLSEGNHNFVFAMESEYREFVVECGDFQEETINTVKRHYPTATKFFVNMWSTLEATVQVDGVDYKPHGVVYMTVERNEDSIQSLVWPNGKFGYPVSGKNGDVYQYTIKNGDAEVLAEHPAYVVDGSVKLCEYSVDTLPTLGKGTVAFAIVDDEEKPVTGGFTLVNPGTNASEQVEVTDEFGIVEVEVSRASGENETFVLCSIGGFASVNHKVTFTGAPVASEFRNLDIPTQGDTETPITVTGQVYDQGGSAFKPPRLGVFDKQSLTHQAFDASLIGSDGTFSFEYGPLSQGQHDLVLGSSGIISEKRTHWSIGFPDGLRTERMNYSTYPNAYVGDDAIVAVRASIVEDGLLVPVVGVPATAYINGPGVTDVELETKLTDANGIAEFNIPASVNETTLNGNYAITMVVGPNVVRTDITWLEGSDVISGFSDLDYNPTINTGGELVYTYRPLNQDGQPMADRGVYVTPIDHFQIGAYNATIYENADGSYTAEFPTMEDGTYDVVFHSGNAQERMSLTWGAYPVINPTSVLLDFLSPTSGVVGSDAIVSGKIVDENGSVIRPTAGMRLTVRDETGSEIHVRVKPDGSWSFAANSTIAKTKSYNILHSGTNLYVHQIDFHETPTVTFTDYTGDKVAKTHEAMLATVVKDVDGNGIPGMLVEYKNDDTHYGSVITDEFGIAEFTIPFNLETIVSPTVEQDYVVAHISDTISDDVTVRWAGDDENSAIEIIDLVVDSDVYEGTTATITGRLIGSLGTNDNAWMWLTVFNKTTLESKMFNNNIMLDGTFEIEVGPYPMGLNQLVIATNSYTTPISLEVTEAPIVLKELRTLPYSTTKVKSAGSATLAFAAINSLDKGMVGETVELRLASDTGILLDSVVTDQYGIAEFTILDNETTPNTGDVTYVAVSGGFSAQSIVSWGETGVVIESLGGFEATGLVSSGAKGVIKLSPLSKLVYDSGSFAQDPNGKLTPWETMSHVRGATINVFDKVTLSAVPHNRVNADVNVGGEKFDIYTVDALPDGFYDLVVYSDNTIETATMTWDAETELAKPDRFTLTNSITTAFVQNDTNQWLDGDVQSTSGPTFELTGYVEPVMAGAQEHPVWITPKGRFVTKLSEPRSEGVHSYDFKVDGAVVDTKTITFYDSLNVTLLPYTTPNPVKGKAATVAAVVKDGSGRVVPDACVTLTPGARITYEHLVNLNSDFNGSVEMTWEYDEAYPEFTLITGCNGKRNGETQLLRWVESPELTGDSFETLVVPEKVVGDNKATITGKILDQEGNPYANGELLVYNKITMTSTDLTTAIQPDGTFSTELGPYPFNAYELIFATRGNVDRRTTVWGGSGILASITIDPESGTRGLLGDTVAIFGTSTDTIGTPFIPDEGSYALSVTNDKNDEVLPVVIDGMSNWNFNASHDVEETITYTFKDGETALATHSVEFFVGAGTLRNFDFGSSPKTASLDETFTLTGKVFNTSNELYKPISEEAFTLRLDETTDFLGTIHTDGTFSVVVTNDVVETKTYTFEYLETDYETVDVRWCETLTLSFNGDSQPKAVVGDDAYVSIKVVDENGIAPEGREIEFYEGDTSGTPLYAEEITSNSYIGYWPAEATVEGDVTIIAKLGERETTMTLTWVGNEPKIAAGFGRKTTLVGYVVDKKPASGTTSTLRGTVVDQDGLPLAGPQMLKVFDQGSSDLTDYSAQVQADGTFDIELPAQPDGTYNYSLVTEGNVGLIGGLTWDAANEDLKTVKLDASVPTQVNVASTHTLQGTILDSLGSVIAPAESITVYVNSSESSTYEFTVTPDGTWSFAYTFSNAGDVLFDFHTYEGKYLGSITIAVEAAPPQFTSIEWVGEQPAEGMVGEPVKLTAVSLDQYGDPIEGVSVRPFINGEPQNAFRSPPGGSWSLDYTSNEAGPVLYEFGWEPGVPRIGHTVVWKLPVSSIESLRYSDSNAVPGQDAFASFAAVNAEGQGIAGVPITVHLDTTDGPELATVVTDADGIAEFNIPQKGTDSSRLVYAKYDSVVKERRQWWANDATATATGFANFSVTSPVPNGERASVSVQTVNKDGLVLPLASVGIFDRTTLDQIAFNKVSTGESKSFILDFAGSGAKDYVLVTDAGRMNFSVTWDDSAKITPDGVTFDADSPDAVVINEWAEISGRFTVAGTPVTKLNSYVKATVTVDGVESNLAVDQDTGAFSAMIRPTVEGQGTYTFKVDDVVIATKIFKHVDTVTFSDMDVLSVTAPKVYEPAEVGVVVKDGSGNSIPGVMVTWSVVGESEPRGITKADEDGIALFSIPHVLGVTTVDVVAEVNSVTSTVTVAWKPSNEPSDVSFETLTVPSEIYDLEVATITGKIVNQSGEGIATTKFDVYHRDMLTYTSHSTEVQADGTFSFDIGPFDIGVNSFYFCINGKREAREITVVERTTPKLSTVELDESNPTEGNSSEVLTVSGTGYDQYGEVFPNGSLQWSIGGEIQAPLTTSGDGTFSVQVTNNTDGPVVYSFGGNDDIPVKELTINWIILVTHTMSFAGTSKIVQPQGDSSRVELFVKDEDGLGVENASIVLTDQDSGATLATIKTGSRGTASHYVAYEAGNNVRTIVASYEGLTETLELTWVESTTKFAAGFDRLYVDTRPASGKSTTIRGQLVDQNGDPITTATTLGVFNGNNLDNIDYISALQPDGSFEFEYGPAADGNYNTYIFTDGGVVTKLLVWSVSNRDIKRGVIDDSVERMTRGGGRVTIHGTFLDSDNNPVNPSSNTSCTAYSNYGDTFSGSISTNGTFSVEVYFSEFRTYEIDIVGSDGGYLATHSLIVTPDNILAEMPYSANVATIGQPATMAVRVTDQTDSFVAGTEVTAHLGDPNSPAVVTATTDELGIAAMLVPAPAEAGITTVYFKNGTSVLDAAVNWKPVDELVGRTFADIVTTDPVDYGQPATITGKLLDQNSNVLPGRNLQVYHLNGSAILDSTVVKNDETGFELNVGPLPTGTHRLILYVGNAERYEEITWDVEIPPIGEIETMSLSSTKAPTGVDASASFTVLASNGARIKDVPVTARWGNATGEVIAKLNTDDQGVVTYTLPGTDGGVDRIGVHTVYVSVGGKSATWNVEWVDGELIGQTIVNFDNMQDVVYLEKFLGRMTVHDQNGDVITNPRVALYDPKSRVERPLTILDYPGDEIVFQGNAGSTVITEMMISTENDRIVMPIRWSSDIDPIEPVSAKVTSVIPDYNPLGQDLLIKGKVLDLNGEEFRPTTILNLRSMRGETTTISNMVAMPDGEWAFVVNETEVGEQTYKVMRNTTELLRFTVRFGDAPTMTELTLDDSHADGVYVNKTTTLTGQLNDQYGTLFTPTEPVTVTATATGDTFNFDVGTDGKFSYDFTPSVTGDFTYALSSAGTDLGTWNFSVIEEPVFLTDAGIDVFERQTEYPSRILTLNGRVLDQNGSPYIPVGSEVLRITRTSDATNYEVALDAEGYWSVNVIHGTDGEAVTYTFTYDGNVVGEHTVMFATGNRVHIGEPSLERAYALSTAPVTMLSLNENHKVVANESVTFYLGDTTGEPFATVTSDAAGVAKATVPAATSELTADQYPTVETVIGVVNGREFSWKLERHHSSASVGTNVVDLATVIDTTSTVTGKLVDGSGEVVMNGKYRLYDTSKNIPIPFEVTKNDATGFELTTSTAIDLTTLMLVADEYVHDFNV